VVDGAGHLEARGLQLVLEVEQVLLGGHRERHVVEADRLVGGRAVELGPLHGLGDVVLEEGDLAHVHLEEVVAKAVVADPRHQPQTQQVPVKADRLGHVVGDEGEVVEALEQHGDLQSYPGPRGHFPVV
jgi:hypothetical protein